MKVDIVGGREVIRRTPDIPPLVRQNGHPSRVIESGKVNETFVGDTTHIWVGDNLLPRQEAWELAQRLMMWCDIGTLKMPGDPK